MTIAEYIEQKLADYGYKKTWLSDLLNISKQKLNYRFKQDCFSANELFLIADNLDLDLEVMREEIGVKDMKTEILKNIVKNAKRMDKIESFSDEYGTTDVYGIKTESRILKAWNSSNQEAINQEEVLETIADELENGETEGSFIDNNCNEIQWEVIEK